MNGKMVQVLWNRKRLAMFAIDLEERGCELTGPIEVHNSETTLDSEQRRIAASERFTQIMGEVPSGLPHSDGTHRIRLASREYADALAEAVLAMTRLNEFLVRGIIPPDLKGKPPAKETLEPPNQRSGEGD